jgi:methylmalonyl-CoA epimerase
VAADLVSHVGIAVNSLAASIPLYEQLTGQKAGPIIEVTVQRVRIVMIGGSNGARIELLEGMTPDSPVARFIAQRGEGLHHVCIHVDNIEARLAELKRAGAKLIDEQPRLGADGGKIAFVHPSSAGGVLLELHQKAS